jgi:hypothetical protein
MRSTLMRVTKDEVILELAQEERSAHDPDGLGALDAEAGEYDDESDDGIDWDEIIRRDEVDTRPPVFSSSDYATDEESMAALKAFIHAIFVKVLSRETSNGKDAEIGFEAVGG